MMIITAHLTAIYPRQHRWAGTRKNIHSLPAFVGIIKYL